MRDFTIANLEMACWIARLGSFTAAADRLHTTQPAISARVKDLEESLGLKLFDRHTRGVELTLEGRDFLLKAEPLLKDLEELAFTASKSSAGGLIRLGASSICLEIIADLASDARTTFPNLNFVITTDRAATLLENVAARKIDLAIVSGPIDAHQFASMSLGRDQFQWMLSSALYDSLEDRSLAGLFGSLPIWCVSHDSFYWATARESLQSSGIKFNRIHEFSNTLGLSRIIAHGGGIGLLSRTAAAVDLARGTLRAVPGLESCEQVEFSIVCRKDQEANCVFAEIMRTAVRLSTLEPSEPPAQLRAG